MTVQNTDIRSEMKVTTINKTKKRNKGTLQADMTHTRANHTDIETKSKINNKL